MYEWIGRTLGKVQIESLLARGGVAEIYLGTHTTLQRKVAVKILRNQYEDDPNLLERFQREAVVVSRLRHPNIVQILDFDSTDGHPYIVMEYIAGPSLSRYLDALHANARRLDLPVISRLLSAVAGALEYAHEKGVIHRDVKPGNILLTSQTDRVIAGNTMPVSLEPVLTDFGLVRFLNSSRQTSAGQIAGTPAYMSPEQARGETTDERTDIYSLGVVLYEMLSGRVPFEGETTMSVLLKHIHDPPDPIPDLAPALQNVLNHALEKTRADRFQSPLDFASAFQTAIAQRYFTDTLIKEPVPPQPQTNSVSGKKWRPILVLGVMTFLIGTFLWGRNLQFQGLPAATETPTIFSTSTVSIQVAFIRLGSTGILSFHDGKAIADQAVFIAQAMPQPPQGYQYEVWLVGEEGRKSLGILSLNEQGKGELSYTDADGVNLIGRYEKVEITLETDPDSDTPGLVVYGSITPGEGEIHIRELLSSSTTEEGGLIHGLTTIINQIDQSAHEMSTTYANRDETTARQLAESIMNILVGDQSLDYMDWDGDGQFADPLDGYGLLLNGRNLGYLQAVFSEADYAANSPGVTQKMIVNGEYVKTCVQSLAQWAPQLRESVLAILTSPKGLDLTPLIQDSVVLADQMLTGVDLNGNEVIDRVIGECGVLTAYESAYFMADMHLLPIAQKATPTTTPDANTTPSATNTTSKFIATPTKTSRESQFNPGFVQPSNTPVPPTHTPVLPTNTPIPTPQPTTVPTQPPTVPPATPVNTPVPTDPPAATDTPIN